MSVRLVAFSYGNTFRGEEPPALPELSASRAAVLSNLCWHAQDDGTNRKPLPQETIVRETRQSESTVKRALENLERLGLIRRERRGRVDFIKVTLPIGVTTTPVTVTPIAADTGHRDDNTGHGDRKRGHGDTLNNRTTKNNDGRDDFSRFLEVYPKRTGEAEARRAWQTITETTPAAYLIKAAGRYAETLTAPKFAEQPAIWLAGSWWREPVRGWMKDDIRWARNYGCLPADAEEMTAEAEACLAVWRSLGEEERDRRLDELRRERAGAA